MTNDYGFGVSFLPNGDQKLQRQGQVDSSAQFAPVQEAIKVLSLRVPRVVGANPMAPLALLQSQGGQGMPEGILQQLLRTLGQVPATNPGGPMAGPGQIGIQGAGSPFASGEGARQAPLGPAPMPSITAGGTAPPPGIPQTTQIPAGTPPSMPPAQTPGQDLWAQAQRARNTMGRVQY